MANTPNPTADDKLCTALSAAKIRGPEIASLLHSAYHDGMYLPTGRIAERIADARRGAEALLAAIVTAQEARDQAQSEAA